MIRYLGGLIRRSVLILPKTSGCVKIFKDKGEDKNNKLISLHIDYDKLFKKCKTIWTKLEDVQNIELGHLPVHDDRNIKTTVR